MPWTETAPMKERIRFVTNWERDLYSMVELCERCGVSRKTGYKWGSTVALCFGVESCTRGSAPRVVLGESLSTLAVYEKGGGRADLVDCREGARPCAAGPPDSHRCSQKPTTPGLPPSASTLQRVVDVNALRAPFPRPVPRPSRPQPACRPPREPQGSAGNGR